MKKIFAVLMVLLLSAGFVFADEAADDYDDGFVYENNGKGDQYLKIGIMPFFPLNFGDQLKVGGGAEIGYYRFVSENIAMGGEITVTFNPTLAKNALTLIPITFNVMYQPVFGKIEVPLTLGVGTYFATAQNASYFPGLSLVGEAGVFYRFSEMWSFGAEGKFVCTPQWVKNSEYNKTGLFAGLTICARYHF